MKSNFSFKCPGCSFEGKAKDFAKVKSKPDLKWYSIVSSRYETSCPSCGLKLGFSNKVLTASLAVLLFVCADKMAKLVPENYILFWQVAAPIFAVLGSLAIFKKLVKLVSSNA